MDDGLIFWWFVLMLLWLPIFDSPDHKARRNQVLDDIQKGRK